MNLVGPTAFSRAMILGLRAGRKTETRRMMQPQPASGNYVTAFAKVADSNLVTLWKEVDRHHEFVRSVKYPYGKSGDSRWIQEEHQLVEIGPLRKGRRVVTCQYLADNVTAERELTVFETDKLDSRRTDPKRPMPGRFMYQSLSRSAITLTGVRPERLQQLTEQDAYAEGVDHDGEGVVWIPGTDLPQGLDPRQVYFGLWDSLHPKEPAATDPYVWRLVFTFST